MVGFYHAAIPISRAATQSEDGDADAIRHLAAAGGDVNHKSGVTPTGFTASTHRPSGEKQRLRARRVSSVCLHPLAAGAESGRSWPLMLRSLAATRSRLSLALCVC